jgi:GMP synthase-like glutamine amidotransferase
VARALVVQHAAHEGLGWFQEWWPAVGLDVHPIHPYLGHRVPRSVEGDALVVLGGPMGVYDDDGASWLPAVRELVASAVDDGVPTLGLCLGAQLLAVACGGTVGRGDLGPELGYGEVDVLADDDALLLPGPMPVVQWHFDEVTELPGSAVLLASSDRYRVQAFRVGEVAWGLQFHVETTLPMVADWARNDAAAVREAQRRAPEDLVAEVAGHESALTAAGEALAHRFAAIITG